jgi:hypothetical protein
VAGSCSQYWPMRVPAAPDGQKIHA